MFPRLIAIASLSAALAACGSSNPTPTSTTPGAGKQDLATAAFKYASCMRTHGVPNFPDPKVTTSPGHQSVGIQAVGPAGKTAQSRAALKACSSILPGPQNVSPAEQAQQDHVRAQHLLAFAKCMRAHGVSGFPDPTSTGQITREMLGSAGVDVRAPNVLAAVRTCIPASDGAVTPAEVNRAVNGQH